MLLRSSLSLIFAAAAAAPPLFAQVHDAEMAGYMLVPTEQVPANFNAGFSLYAAAWPLLAQYPGHRFQTGLFGTWMHAKYEGKPVPPENPVPAPGKRDGGHTGRSRTPR